MDTAWKIGKRKLTSKERAWAMALVPVKERAVNREGEQIRGTVVAANARGFQLHGEEQWRNWSKFAEEPRTLPAPGHRVRVEIDGQGFVRGVNIIGGGAVSTDKQLKTTTTNQTTAANGHSASDALTERWTHAAVEQGYADRKFRLDCLKLVVSNPELFNDILGSEGTLLGLADEIAAWAEGRE